MNLIQQITFAISWGVLKLYTLKCGHTQYLFDLSNDIILNLKCYILSMYQCINMSA